MPPKQAPGWVTPTVSPRDPPHHFLRHLPCHFVPFLEPTARTFSLSERTVGVHSGCWIGLTWGLARNRHGIYVQGMNEGWQDSIPEKRVVFAENPSKLGIHSCILARTPPVQVVTRKSAPHPCHAQALAASGIPQACLSLLTPGSSNVNDCATWTPAAPASAF